MLPDDTFRARLKAAIAGLEAWAADAADVARIETGEADGGWRMAVTPEAPQACPFELNLRRDQHYDLTVGPETYEDQVVESLDLFRSLVDAIADGRVVVRRTASAATGLPQAVETLAALGDGSEWRGLREVNTLPGDGHFLVRDEHFVPYRRSA